MGLGCRLYGEEGTVVGFSRAPPGNANMQLQQLLQLVSAQNGGGLRAAQWRWKCVETPNLGWA